VNGELKVGTTAIACSGTNPGAILYSGGAVQYCNGTAWGNIGTAAAAAGADGDIQYNNGGSALGGDANLDWDDTNKILTIIGNGSANEFLKIINNHDAGLVIQANAGAGLNPYINFRRSRGTSAAPTIVLDNDDLLWIGALGYGSNYDNAAFIRVQVDGTPGTNDLPGRIVFYTTPDGSNTPVEAMRINNKGYVGINNSNPAVSLVVTGGFSTYTGSTTNLTSDNQTVTVGNTSYLRLSSNNATSTNRTFCLTTGLETGQHLTIEVIAQTAELADNSVGTCAGSPVAANLSALKTFNGADDTLELIYNGTRWIEVARSDN
jgi:hypothetical protein